MAEILVMPKLGLTMEEGVVARWLCEPGTTVALGQGICEVETDKLSVVVESPYAGTLLRCIEPDATVPVGEPIAVIGEPGEDTAAHRLYQPIGGGASTPPAPPSAGPPQPAAAAASRQDRPAEGAGQESPAAAPAQREAVASPLARRIAATLGVDLAGVDGTGPAGRITKEDVERAAALQGLAVPPTPEGGFR